jgi:trans-aconitate 2-methyltransferase
MQTWTAEQYLKFEQERIQPCRDLATNAYVEKVRKVVDLGCGPGNTTRVLVEHWPDAGLIGVDSSSETIDVASKTTPDIRWINCDIARWAKTEVDKFDVVFSNAALHWVEDYGDLYPKLLARVLSGGALAIQRPVNTDTPAEQLRRQLVHSSKWRDRFAVAIEEWYANDIATYYDQLAPRCQHIRVWNTDYFHVLPDLNAVVEWYKWTGLRPTLNALANDIDREEFLSDFLDGIRDFHPPQADNRILFTVRRGFLVAYPKSSGDTGDSGHKPRSGSGIACETSCISAT